MMVLDPYRFGFSPLQLPGLVGWYDSTDDSKITIATGVSAWQSKQNVGGVKTLSQGAAGSQPTLVDVDGVQMLSFDGSNDWMTVSDGGAYGFGGGSFSIYIVYKTDDVNRGLMFQRGSFGPTGYFCRINNADSNNGDFVVAIRDASSNLGLVSATAINYNDNGMRLLSMVRDEGVSELVQYQDGVEVAASPAAIAAVGDIDSGGSVHIGAWLGSSQQYNGEMGDILVFNRVLSASEQTDLETYLMAKFAPEFSPLDISGLVGWYDSTDNDTITISTGVSAWASKQNVGGTKTLVQTTGAEQPVLLDVSGVQMVSFDGSNDGLSVVDSSAFAFAAGSFSVYLVYKSADANRGVILHRGTISPAGYYLRLNDADTDNGDFALAMRDGSSNLGLSSAVSIDYNDDAMRMMAMVRDEGTSEMLQYQNGIEIPEGSTDITSVGDIDQGTIMYVGVFNDGAQFYDGELGDILIFNKVLSPAERAALTLYLSTKFGI